VRQVLLDDPTQTLRPRRRQRLVGVRRGDPLDLLRLDSAVVRLRDAYWEAGYADAVVSAPVIGVDSVADTAAVRIPVRRGLLQRIDSIVVLNQTPGGQVDEETVRHSLVVRQGDVFKRSTVAQSQRALYESGLFRSAVLDTAVTTIPGTNRVGCASQAGLRDAEVRPPIPDEPPPDSTKSLVVCLTEGPFRDVRTSVGFSTADFGQAEARFTHNHWLDGPNRLELSGVVGNLGASQLYNTPPFRGANGFTVGGAAVRDLARQGRYFAPTYQAGADLRRRYFASPRNTLGLGIFTHRRSAPAVFVDRGQGANLSLTREVAQQVPVSASYRFELNRVEASDVYFCVNFSVCDRGTASALSRQQRLSPLALTGAVNRTDHPFSPRRGVLARFSLEYASNLTVSDFAYARGQLEASTYRTVPLRRSVLAVRGRLGYVRALGGTNERLGVPGLGEGAAVQLLHPRTRFYAGGAQSVRGFGENQLGPRVLTVDPQRLLTAEGNTCGGEVRGCDLNATRVAGTDREEPDRRPVYRDDDFIARPLGGTTIVEGNVELRVPITGPIVGAVFLDGAVLGERSLGPAVGRHARGHPGRRRALRVAGGPGARRPRLPAAAARGAAVVTQQARRPGRQPAARAERRPAVRRRRGGRLPPLPHRGADLARQPPHPAAHAAPLDRRGVLMADPLRPDAPPPGAPASAARAAPPRRRARLARWAAALVALLVVAAVAAVFVVTNTDWGRERLRRQVVKALAGTVHGRFQVGRVSGNLLRGLTLHDVAIADSAGLPFLRVDSATTRYGLRSFFSKKIELSGVTLWRPVIVLDRPPGKDWNFARIFPGDTAAKDTSDTAPGWGDWLVFRDARIVNGDFTVRTPWAPSDSLTAAQRDSAVRLALDSTAVVASRARIERVPGGYQNVQHYRQLHAALPLVRLAHPDHPTRRVEIASLRALALPLRPPGAEVRQAQGAIELNADSLWFRRLDVSLPNSRATFGGATPSTRGRSPWPGAPTRCSSPTRASPAPRCPTGIVRSGFVVSLDSLRTAVRLNDLDAAIEQAGGRPATARGTVGLVLGPGDTVRFDGTNVTFADVSTRLVERLARRWTCRARACSPGASPPTARSSASPSTAT
jgi:outer membrane translocation and assembly module TamA